MFSKYYPDGQDPFPHVLYGQSIFTKHAHFVKAFQRVLRQIVPHRVGECMGSVKDVLSRLFMLPWWRLMPGSADCGEVT